MSKLHHIDASIYFSAEGFNALNLHINQHSYSKIFLLVDENTHTHCAPLFLPQLITNIPIEIIEITSGEIHKSIETSVSLWNTLADLDADKSCVLINLGGGVLTDLGGFVAATFKRGISTIHVPTTLLAMVDAAVGGKNGVNLGTLKNQVGVIRKPNLLLINPSFLTTLPMRELRSGYAEMLKHGLIKDEPYWQACCNIKNITADKLDALIYQSVVIKSTIVSNDLYEKNSRKVLNFGHTLGHAIETYFLKKPKKNQLLHGEAIAIGIILESYISVKKVGLPEVVCQSIATNILAIFPKITIEASEYSKIIALLKHDKKNRSGTINFVLLQAIGKPKIDCVVNDALINEAFLFYSSF